MKRLDLQLSSTLRHFDISNHKQINIPEINNTLKITKFPNAQNFRVIAVLKDCLEQQVRNL